MILADKIILLRKKKGWSQEEFAEQMNVSRQAVSKWESAASTPDLEKILQISKLFNVTTDYLLKNDLEEDVSTPTDNSIKTVTLEESLCYLVQNKKTAWRTAIATFLCIICPLPLIVLAFLSDELNPPILSESMAAAIGLIALFVLILCAVPLFIYCEFQNEPYAFLDKSEPFLLESSAKACVENKQKAFRNTYITCNILSTCLYVFSPLPLIISSFTEIEPLIIGMVCALFCIIGIATVILMIADTQNKGMQKLLNEGKPLKCPRNKKH